MIAGLHAIWRTEGLSINGSEIILAVVAATPGTLAWLTRRKDVTERASTRAKQAAVEEFKVLFNEQRLQITECRTECTALRMLRETDQKEISALKDATRKLTSELNEEQHQREYL